MALSAHPSRPCACAARAGDRPAAVACARPPSAIARWGSSSSAQPPLVSSSSSSSSARRGTPTLARASPQSARSIPNGRTSVPALQQGGRRRSVLTTTTASAAAPSTSAATTAATTTTTTPTTFSFACPICHDTPFALPASDPYASDCACPRCGRTFLVSRGGGGNGKSASSFVDLTLQSGAQPQVFEQKSWVGTELFRTEAVSSIYERGWRQGFARAGFPGPQREFDLAMRYFAPVLGKSGGGEGEGEKPILVDASCGTGLFTRLFARSGEFSGVVALDYSETMLRETRRLLAASSPQPATPVVAVRADIARLPFATGSVHAIHAGAALHCWPQPSAAMAEVSRVLAPGGVFVASTFLTPLSPLGAIVGDERVRPLTKLTNPFGFSSSFRSWEEAEIVDLCREVGLVSYARTRDRAFILFSAQKPRF